MVWLAKLFSSRITWLVLAVIGGWLFSDWLEDRGYDRGVAAERDRQAKAQLQIMMDVKTRHEQELRTRGWQDKQEADYASVQRQDLQNRLAELMATPPKILIKTVVKQNEDGHSCPDPSLGNAFWLRYRSAGDPGGSDDPSAAGTVRNKMR